MEWVTREEAMRNALNRTPLIEEANNCTENPPDCLIDRVIEIGFFAGSAGKAGISVVADLKE